jgi:hypothetical protein
MSSTSLATVLASVLESKGITPESLLQSADLSRLLAEQNTPEATKEATVSIPANSIVVQGIIVPAPVKGQPITQEIKKAYNSALSRTGNGTLGAGGATFENLLAKFTLLAGLASTPAQAQTQTALPDQEMTLARLVTLLTPVATGAPAPTTAAPGTLRHAISTYQPKTKTRVWIKADGTRIQCTEAQFQMWSKRRAENVQKQQAVQVQPVLPANISVDTIAQALVSLLAGAQQG